MFGILWTMLACKGWGIFQGFTLNPEPALEWALDVGCGSNPRVLVGMIFRSGLGYCLIWIALLVECTFDSKLRKPKISTKPSSLKLCMCFQFIMFYNSVHRDAFK